MPALGAEEPVRDDGGTRGPCGATSLAQPAQSVVKQPTQPGTTTSARLGISRAGLVRSTPVNNAISQLQRWDADTDERRGSEAPEVLGTRGRLRPELGERHCGGRLGQLLLIAPPKVGWGWAPSAAASCTRSHWHGAPLSSSWRSGPPAGRGRHADGP